MNNPSSPMSHFSLIFQNSSLAEGVKEGLGYGR